MMYSSGLAFEEVDQGRMENIAVSNITMNHVHHYPIYITTGCRNRGPKEVTSPSYGGDIMISNVIADDADSLVLSPKRTAKWAATPDSLYRALLYYNVPASGIEVKAISLTSVPAPRVRPKDEVKEITTDPVVFNSAWMSREGRYINLGLSLKTGQAEGVDEKQTVGLMCDEVTTDAEGHKHYMLTLLHEQNGVPQYYSAELFMSIASYRLPEKPVKGDELTIKINTYNGTIEKSFQY